MIIYKQFLVLVLYATLKLLNKMVSSSFAIRNSACFSKAAPPLTLIK